MSWLALDSVHTQLRTVLVREMLCEQVRRGEICPPQGPHPPSSSESVKLAVCAG